jgi:NTP pyrophosphatase (non-canonical NTP hydrolase)
MRRTLNELHGLMVDQLKRRGFYPDSELEVVLRINEEIGEMAEALREKQSNEILANEIVDVFWNLMRLCELKHIDLEEAFLRKWNLNETRPNPNNRSRNCD